jgi:hypothetical protein
MNTDRDRIANPRRPAALGGRRTLVAAVWLSALTASAQSVPWEHAAPTAYTAVMTVGDAPALNPVTGLTVEAWFYLDPIDWGGGNGAVILRKGGSTPSYLLDTTSTLGGFLRFSLRAAGLYFEAISPTPAPVGSWHHVAGTHDNLALRLYVDGVLVATTPATGTTTPSAGALRIGNREGGGTPWHGGLDEIRIWSAARSEADIAARRFQRLDAAAGLVAAWHFDGDYVASPGGFAVTLVDFPRSPATSPVEALLVLGTGFSRLGDPLPLSIRSTYPSTPYLMEVSLTGSAPGVALPAPLFGAVPLNPPWIYLELGWLLPPEWFGSFLGVTDGFGDAEATLAMPEIPQLLGAQLHAAAIAFDVAAPFAIGAVSAARRTTLHLGPAVVASLTPSVVPAFSQTTVTVAGSGFYAGTTVHVGTTSAINVQVLSPNLLTFVTPPLSVGARNVSITTPGNPATVVTDGLIYSGPVTLTSLTPQVAAPGAVVTAVGTGLNPAPVVTVSGLPATVLSASPTSLTFVVPSGAPCDAVVQVTIPATGASATRAWNPTPVVTSSGSPSGPAAGGGNFVLIGSGLVSGTAVTIGGAPATVTTASGTALVLVVPPGTPGPAAIVLTSTNGCASTAPMSYVYL